MSVILSAARIADEFFRNMKRNHSGWPAMSHMNKIAGRVATRPWATENDVAIAFLHDIDEDIGFLNPDLRPHIIAQIVAECGEPVWAGVKMLTNASLGLKLPRAERKKMDRDKIAQCPQPIKGIKLIDRDENIIEFTNDFRLGADLTPQFLNMYCDESMLMLNEALRGADDTVAAQLYDNIQTLRRVCAKKK